MQATLNISAIETLQIDPAAHVHVLYFLCPFQQISKSAYNLLFAK